MAIQPGQLSPFLVPFLLQQGESGKKRNTTADLLPEQISEGTFSGIQLDPSGSYRTLSTLSSGASQARADNDFLHQTRMVKKQQALQEKLYKEQQKLFMNQIKNLVKKNSAAPKPPPASTTPISPNANYVPKPPPIPPSPASVLPEIKPKPVYQHYSNPGYGDTTIQQAPKDDCPAWKKLLGMC